VLVGTRFVPLWEKLTRDRCGYKRKDKEQAYAPKYPQDRWKRHGRAVSRFNTRNGPIPVSGSTHDVPNREHNAAAGPQAESVPGPVYDLTCTQDNGKGDCVVATGADSKEFVVVGEGLKSGASMICVDKGTAVDCKPVSY